MYRMLVRALKKKYIALLLVLTFVTLGYFAITTSHNAKAQTVIDPSIVPSEITPSPTETSSNYFLKIDGVPGESTDAKHKGEIDILSFHWGETQPGTQGQGGGSGKVNMQDVHFVMKFNKASPKLFLACANGQHLPSATLVLRKAGKDQQEYLKWTFTDVMCTSYQTGGTNPDVPTDQFSLNFGKIEVEYKAQKPDGTLEQPISAGWDLKKNQSE